MFDYEAETKVQPLTALLVSEENPVFPATVTKRRGNSCRVTNEAYRIE